MEPVFRNAPATAYIALVIANALFKRLHEDDQKAILEDLIATLSKINGDLPKEALVIFRKELADLSNDI